MNQPWETEMNRPWETEEFFKWQEKTRKRFPMPPKTNADRLRQMTDEELAEFMKPYDSGCPRWNGKEPIPCSKRTNCRDCWLDWLKSPVEEVDNGT